MIKRYHVAGKGLIESSQDVGAILVAAGPDEKERTLLQEQFHLDEYDMASIFDPDEVPRLDVAGGRLLAIWKFPEKALITNVIELGVKVSGLAIFQDNLALIEPPANLYFKDREFRNVGDVKDVLLAFLLCSVRHFVGHLKAIKQISVELEKKITVSMENRHLIQMFSLSESLVYYIDAIEGNAAVLARLRHIGGQYGFDANHLALLDDIILENTQAARQANIFSSVLSGLMDARGTIVNNNMSVLLKNLTLINIVFLPLNLIAGILGMSEWSMMTQKFGWQMPYILFCVAMLAIGWGTWILMKKLVDRGPQ